MYTKKYYRFLKLNFNTVIQLLRFTQNILQIVIITFKSNLIIQH